jgi:membrane associated rhomboid family serine protease
MQASSFFVGPHQTPKSVKWLIAITLAVSILSPLTSYFLAHYFYQSGPLAWLPLSLSGLQQGWVWQPFTYFFLHSAGLGISLSLLISLFFHMLLLWFAGSEIDFRFGSKEFILFYLGAGIFAGLVAAAALFLFSSQSILIGSGPPVYASMMVWAMTYPDLELFFFFLIRIKAKWLVALYLVFALLINLSYGAFIPFLADLSAIVWGFLIGRWIWRLPNPYPLNLEIPFRRQKRTDREDKIIDITVFQEDDDAFMDRMLDKIAREGEKALTKRERERMKKISEKKKIL